jgi:hypothetical protein
VEAELAGVLAVELEVVLGEVEIRHELAHVAERGVLGDLDAGLHGAGGWVLRATSGAPANRASRERRERA